jgi:hypothetical protein
MAALRISGVLVRERVGAVRVRHGKGAMGS